STGAITPVTWILGPGGPDPPPSWLTLRDNGDGTAFLKGMPPAGTAETVTVGILVHAFGAGLNSFHAFNINVLSTPVFLSPNTATFTVGIPGTFDISTTGGTVSLINSLPQGLSFTASQSITGTPAAGTGGQYTIALTDDG